MERFKKRFLIRETIAVAGVIELLLIIALFAIVLAMIQLTYIPEIMEQNEAKHMDEVSNQFSRLKAMIDIQAKQNTTIPISNIITMGNRQLPYLVTMPSRGDISLIDNDTTNSKINITNGSININYPLTSIKYESNNLYFVPQTYILEGGGVIIKQPEGNPVMWENPPFNATPIRDHNGHVTIIEMHFDIPVFICEDENDKTSGLDFCYVRTNYSDELSDDDWNYMFNISNINISSEYSYAWFSFVNTSFEKDVRENITFYQKSNYVRIEKKDDIRIDMYYRKNCIYARLD